MGKRRTECLQLPTKRWHLEVHLVEEMPTSLSQPVQLGLAQNTHTHVPFSLIACCSGLITASRKSGAKPMSCKDRKQSNSWKWLNTTYRCRKELLQHTTSLCPCLQPDARLWTQDWWQKGVLGEGWSKLAFKLWGGDAAQQKACDEMCISAMKPWR